MKKKIKHLMASGLAVAGISTAIVAADASPVSAGLSGCSAWRNATTGYSTCNFTDGGTQQHRVVVFCGVSGVTLGTVFGPWKYVMQTSSKSCPSGWRTTGVGYQLS